jgi:hypothetical protein
MNWLMSGLEIRRDAPPVTRFVETNCYVLGRASASWYGIPIPYRLATWLPKMYARVAKWR